MGWFQKIFGSELKSFDQSAWEALLDQGAKTASGIFVSPIKAMDCVAVAAAVRIRVETLGSLGLFLYQNGPDDERSKATSHPLFQLLHSRPNPWTSSSAFVMQMETDVILEGSAYALANRVGDKIVELIRLDPLCIIEMYDPISMEPYYEFSAAGGGIKRYAWSEILHIPGSINFANRFGLRARPLSAIRQARQAIGLSMALEAHAARLLGNGARPSGALSTGGKKLDDTAYKRLQKSWRGVHTGENAGGTAILEDGVTFTPITFNSVDLEFNSMRVFQSIEIGRALGVPPNLIYELGRATWSNSEELAQNFLSFSLLGRCKLWQGAISRLLSADEQSTYYAEFEIDSLVKADLAARYDAFSKACGGPFLTVDEIRATDNRPSIPGGGELRPPANATGVTPNPPARTKPVPVAA
jgi:HK97 family phage portal protein